MVDSSMVVYMLVFIGDNHAAKIDFSSLASQSNIDGVARRHVASAVLLDIHIADTYSTVVGFFQFVKVKNSVASHKDFHHLRSKEIDGIHGVVANQHPYLCTVLQYDSDGLPSD